MVRVLAAVVINYGYFARFVKKRTEQMTIDNFFLGLRG